MEEKQLEQNQEEKPMSFITFVIITGFIGGIFWSALGLLGYVFNFTEIRPNVVLEPWALGSWKNKWQGTILSIIVIGVFSIIAALIYYSLFRKVTGLIGGIIYGLILFLFVFFALNPLFPSMKPVQELSKNTIITSVCLYVLYSTFVGYTISYEEQERQYKKNREKEMAQS